MKSSGRRPMWSPYIRVSVRLPYPGPPTASRWIEGPTTGTPPAITVSTTAAQ